MVLSQVIQLTFQEFLNIIAPSSARLARGAPLIGSSTAAFCISEDPAHAANRKRRKMANRATAML